MDAIDTPMGIKSTYPLWFPRLWNFSMLNQFLLWATAAITFGVGLLSLVSQSHVRNTLQSWLSVHFLFGLLLTGFCLMQIFARRQLTALRRPEIHEFSRTLSRTVYVFIYAVIGVRQTWSIAGNLLYGAPMDFDLAQEARRGPDIAGFDLHNDLQAFVISGLAVLVIVRMLMYWTWLHVSDEQSEVIPLAEHPTTPR